MLILTAVRMAVLFYSLYTLGNVMHSLFCTVQVGHTLSVLRIPCWQSLISLQFFPSLCGC